MVFGFWTGLLIALVCLGFAIYQLVGFQGDVRRLLFEQSPTISITNDYEAFSTTLSAQRAAIVARIGLRSVALSLGVGFLFLGFSLFLLGVQGSSNLDAEKDGYKLSLTRLAPGLVVILCAAVVVLVSAVQPLVFDVTYPGSAGPSGSGSGGAVGASGAGSTPRASDNDLWGTTPPTSSGTSNPPSRT